MDVNFTTMELLRKVFTSRLMLFIAVVEMTSGVFRNGIATWYRIFAKETGLPERPSFSDHWGLLLCIFGIIGGSPANHLGQTVSITPRAACRDSLRFCADHGPADERFLFSNQWIVGFAAVLIVMCAIGITSLMSGTAATDFGGRKATATCSGIVDAFAYLGSGLQSVSLGFLTSRSWHWWPAFLVPFAIVGALVALKIWNELPAATRKYIAQAESSPTRNWWWINISCAQTLY